MNQSTQSLPVSMSVSNVLTAVVAALGHLVVTTAVKSDKLVDKTFDMTINLASAGEQVTGALDKRAGIYSNAIVQSGELAEREHILKQKIRLHALTLQEAEQSAQAEAASKPATKKTTK